MSVTIPFTDPVTDHSPVVVSGHVSVPTARTVELVYPDGGRDEAELSATRFYVIEVPDRHLAAVHGLGLLVIARGAEGEPLAEAVVPQDAITPPDESGRPKDPVEVETVTDHGDLTPILRIRGHVYDRAVVRLQLRYPDGRTAPIPLHGRAFDFPVPAARRADFDAAPATVTAFDAAGRQTALRPVAAPSYYRRQELAAP